MPDRRKNYKSSASSTRFYNNSSVSYHGASKLYCSHRRVFSLRSALNDNTNVSRKRRAPSVDNASKRRKAVDQYVRMFIEIILYDNNKLIRVIFVL